MITAPLAPLEGNTLPLASEGAEQDDAAPGEGFDALLALVNAQTVNAPAPVKVMAPSVGVQGAQAAQGKDAANAAKAQASKAIDIAPTQDFLPWMNADANVALQAPVAEGAQAGLPAAVGDAKGKNVSAAPQTGVLQDAEQSLVQTPPVQTEGKGASKSVLPPRKAGGRGLEAPVAESAEKNAALAPAVQTMVQPVPSAPAPVKSTQTQATSPSSDALSAVAPAQPKQTTADVQTIASDEPAVNADMFAAQLAGQGDANGAKPATLPLVAAPARSAAEPVQPAAVAPMPMSNPDTGARVTKIEFFSSESPVEASQPAQGELNGVAPKLEGEQLEAASAKESESSADAELADQREPEQDAPAAATAGAAQAPRFEVTEGKGMRGLDAVVASLLRPYADKGEAKSGARVATASAPHISVETGKSQNVKVEERTANVSQALDAAVLRRQEDERRGDVREMIEAPQPHFQQHVEMPADAPAPAEAAPAATPLPAPAPQPDPDAAMMGKIARGESLNASVSIEHPELGSMDVLVQNQNGRIDVRATLETPRAAAVLRAHESALRYGVQQAGMTFGALRVNARTGEAKVDRSRDVQKRRRDRDWEA